MMRAVLDGPARSRLGLGSCLLALSLLAAACTSDNPSPAPSSGASSGSPATASTASAQGAGAEPVSLRVGEYNCDIADEWPNIDVSKVAEAIAKSKAQVVGIEEGGGQIPQLAKDLGWPYYSVRMQIVSQLPLIDPPDSKGLFTYVQVAPGRVVAMENVHLPSSPYGPNMVRDGKTRKEVVAKEKKVRLPAIQPQLAEAKKLEAQGMPVFLTGDFNSPSFHDWTKATVGDHKYIKYPVHWPVTAAVEKDGFRDSYRTVYPNPVTDPGLTWPVHRPIPGWNPTRNTSTDRVDFIFATKQATPTASIIVGEPGGPQETASVSPYQSDHRDIASTFTITGAVPPVLVSATPRLVNAGDPVTVAFHAPSGAGEQISISDLSSPSLAVPVNRKVTSGSDGSMSFSTDGWQPGAYEAALGSASGAPQSRYPFWVQAPGTNPTISTSKPSFKRGEPIKVDWKNAPGERWDWLGVYKRGANPNVAYYIEYVYTNAGVEGSAAIDHTAVGSWPLPPGKYSVYLLKDDIYIKLAGAPFSVTP